MTKAYKQTGILVDQNNYKNKVRFKDLKNSNNKCHAVTELFVYQNYSSTYRLFFNRDSIGFILETPPVTLSAKETNLSLNKLFRSLLPENSKLQVMIFADPYSNNCLNRWQNFKKNSIIQHITQKPCNYLKKFAFKTGDSPYILRDFRYVIGVSVKLSHNTTNLEKMYNIKHNIKTKLKTTGLQILDWGPSQLINILNHMIRTKNIKIKLKSEHFFIRNATDVTRNKDLNSKILHIDPKLDTDHKLKMNDNKIIIKTFQTAPKKHFWSLKTIGQMIVNQKNSYDLSKIPCPFVINYELQINENILSAVIDHDQSSDKEETLKIFLIAKNKQLIDAEKILLNMSFAKKFNLQENTFHNWAEFLNTMPMMTTS